MTGNYCDAEDLAQESFLSAYRHLSDFDGKYEKAWICKIATNKCLDFKKRASRRQVATEDIFFEFIADDSPSIEDDFLEKAVKEQLLTYCQNLKSPYDEVAEKYFYEELSFAEVAKVLKRNEKTIQTQVYRAKAMLRKQYEVLKKEGVAVNE